jgi:hypothetical protein
MIAPTFRRAVGSATVSIVGQRTALASRGVHRHAFGMLVITEADAAAIRTTFELAAAIELRPAVSGDR